ncbi:Crp/Fnr family transcriptional regulator [Aestuariibacter sp. AA17]|uniref:Crp/Fnr family transcriptional regulator n=1 Tax=Fluctibacter corallii TaxID=2984329 RepID=A0ABT3A414_9ALTE|nr:Crp/Fnr family transcriptional regulator [Aestuariibacter sp. AA17]MCV2883424.1 Crp/Fnr family transcriptional regulator [Aestuariibacter sp. AA17]
MKEACLQALKAAMEGYAPLSATTWEALCEHCAVRTLPKGTMLYEAGSVPTRFGFVVNGLVRSFTINEQGHEYNKNFFAEGQFPGSMTALLTSQPSRLGFETVEESVLVEIDFKGFRTLLFSHLDLMRYHILYLEKNWLLHKDAREIELVQNEASLRYAQFIQDYPNLVDRLPLYHIASHLGITPTQLSRIRKKAVPQK